MKEILALVDDLFFSSKISATAQSCGVTVQLVNTKEALIAKAKRVSPGLVIVDLNGATTRPLEAVQELKSETELDATPVLAFFSHVQTELKEKAVSAGCDSVIPRSVFSQKLAQILRQYSQNVE
jgi:CheY-like chemotaxis protein